MRREKKRGILAYRLLYNKMNAMVVCISFVQKCNTVAYHLINKHHQIQKNSKSSRPKMLFFFLGLYVDEKLDY